MAVLGGAFTLALSSFLLAYSIKPLRILAYRREKIMGRVENMQSQIAVGLETERPNNPIFEVVAAEWLVRSGSTPGRRIYHATANHSNRTGRRSVRCLPGIIFQARTNPAEAV
jgi:hypothetical protein